LEQSGSDCAQGYKNTCLTVQNKLRDILYKKATGYIAQTEYAAQLAISKKWNRNIKVVGNPINSRKESPQRQKQEKIVLSVGRLLSTKNFDRLIKAFIELDQKDWKLIIVGGDHGKHKISRSLKALVSCHQAEDRVLLPGYQSNVADYYERSQIFAFMSSSEGFPNAILEALSWALPVVAFQYNPGIRDLVLNDKNGFLVPLDDDELFKQKLLLLMKDPGLRQRMADEAVHTVKEFELDRIGDTLYDFIYPGS
jgi:glycosyltransferase involved in cell wall biosynthesis